MTKKDPRRSTSLIAHDYQPPAGFRAVQPPVHKASTVVFADTAALRARSWKEKTGYTYGLLGTPTTFTLEERIATLEGGVQTVLVPSGLAAITVVAMALAEGGRRVAHPRQRLRAEQGLRPPRARGLGHRASLLRSDGSAIARRRDRRAHAPGLAGGAGLGDDGVPRPRRPHRHRARARRDGGARQHLGRRTRVRPLPDRRRRGQRAGRGRHLGAGPDQVPVGRRRRADGIGDDPRRGPAPAHQGREHADRLRRRRQRRRARPPVAAVARDPLRSAGARRPRARGVVGGPARGRAGAPSGPRGIARARALEARVQRCSGAVLGRLR